MMFTATSLVILGLAILTIVLPNLGFAHAKKEISARLHRNVCIAVTVIGCILRFLMLGSLTEGVFAEEALVGVQAKSLWQTGGFLFHGGLTTQLAQWAGESTGPLLATLTAPFVGLFGLSPLSVRLPLTLLSCAAMPAAYGLGNALAGKRAGRWCLTAYALCPYFVLMARLTCGANAAIYLLPIALYTMVKGLDKPVFLYGGAVLMGLMAYTQNMYFFIAPAAVLLGGAAAAANGMKKRYAFGAALLGMIICIPALLTLWVNLSGAEGFRFLGVVEIPKLENFDKAESLFDILTAERANSQIQDKTWAVMTGAFFQVLAHMNISSELFAPTGMGALYIVSIPLMLLGGFAIIHGILEGRKPEAGHSAGRVLVVLIGAVTLFALIAYGSVGYLNREGCTSVFDYSALFVFDVLLMVAGLCHLEKKSCAGITGMSALLAAGVVMLCTHLFGIGYIGNTNVYFRGFGELAAKADTVQKESGAKLNVTGVVYPHIAPSDAAEIMYLYATDADMKKAAERRGVDYEVIYAKGIEAPDPQQIYLVTPDDAAEWDLSPFNYEEMGEYVLLTPIE